MLIVEGLLPVCFVFGDFHSITTKMQLNNFLVTQLHLIASKLRTSEKMKIRNMTKFVKKTKTLFCLWHEGILIGLHNEHTYRWCDVRHIICRVIFNFAYDCPK